MELLGAIAGKVLELIVEPIGRQLGYSIFYHRNVTRLEDEFKELQGKREAVQHLVDAARRNGEEIEVEVQDWFASVNEITKREEKLYGEESHAKTGCSYKSCLNLWLRHRLSKEARSMTLKVVEIKEKGNFDKVSYYEPPQLENLLSTGDEGIESRISTMNEVLKELADSNVNMVGLCGLAGVGKTTLAKEVAKKVKEENLFEMVVMVTVAQRPVLKEIQRQIFENVGMQFDVETERIRAGRLYKRLMQEKKLLLVLDDLWERLDLDQVGIPFDFDGKKNKTLDDEEDGHYTSCKILLTSRNEELLSNQMNCKRIIMVGVLSKKEAWELFKEKAELHGVADDPYLHPIAIEAAERCGQLPLAIVTLAGALRKKGLSEWRDALQRLKKPLRRNFTGIKEVDFSLKTSYDYLSQELKSIFLLSAMLPHDCFVSDLLMYSMGLSLFQDVNSMEEARDGLDALINKLKASNLLHDSFYDYHFTMHDVIRDYALSIAFEEQHALVVRHEKHYEFPEKNLLEHYTRLCLDKCEITKLPEEVYCPRLEFFLLDSKHHDLRIPSMFFKSMQELKVMVFTNIHFSSLPSSLCLLEKVKTLCLHSCTLEDIAEVGKLKNLKVLSLASSVIKQLPSELGRLTCLQMLELANCSKLEVIPRNLFSSLKRLEVLNMENSFNQWEAEGSSKGNDNASLIELKHLPNLSSLDICIPNAFALPKDLFLENSLKRYKIFIGKNWEWSSKYETSKTLKLKLKSSIHLELGVQKLLESVEDLCLDKLNGINNVLYDLDGRGFPNLKHLCIQNNNQIEYIINSSGLIDAFPYLETLNLHNLNGLKKLCQGRIMATSFKKLRVIKVSGCNQLKVLFSMSMVGLFGSLFEIDISGCESIKEIVISTNENTVQQNLANDVIIFHQLHSLKMVKLPALTDFFSDKNATNNSDSQLFKSFFSNKVSFPNLEILKISDVNIHYIWNEQLLHNSFSNLKTLLVEHCHVLVKLIPLHILKCLSNLEEVEVRYCSTLEMVFDFEELKSTSKEIHSLPAVPLKKLELRYLPKLKHVWSNDSKVSLPQDLFSNLKTLVVENFHFLVKLIPLRLLKCLSNLEELEVCDCDLLEMVFDFEELKSTNIEIHLLLTVTLKKLELRNLPKLKHVWSNDSKVSFSNLEILEISSVNIQYIWNDQLLHNSFSNLKTLIVKNCHFLVKLIPFDILKCLSNLEVLKVHDCNLLEMVFDFEELKSTNREIHSLPVVPLKMLELWSLPKLKHAWSNDSKVSFSSLEILQIFAVNINCIWHDQLLHNSFNNLKTLVVVDCHFLVKLIPLHILKCLCNLEELEVRYCNSLEIVFDFKELKSTDKEIRSFLAVPLKKLKLNHLPKLKHVWSNYSKGLVSFQSLRDVSAFNCKSLTSMFPASIAEILLHLEELSIENCGIEVIVAKDDVSESGPTFVFAKLTSLKLWDLPNMKNFYPHTHSLECPCLQSLVILKCDELDIFQKDISSSSRLQEEESHHTKYPLFFQEKQIPNLEQLILTRKHAMMIWNGQFPAYHFPKVTSLRLWELPDDAETFPYGLLKRFPNLEELRVEDSSIQEIFSCTEALRDDAGQIAPFRKLTFSLMPKLKHIWNEHSQMDSFLQNLEILNIQFCSYLINLGPSSISLKNLTCLTVGFCHGLLYLLTSSTARSLVQLTKLEIRSCNQIEEIITKQGEDGEQEIVFKKLKYLGLIKLPRLKSFCSHNYTFMFSLLNQVIISMCPDLTIFSPGVIETPSLKGVNDVRWEGNFNKTIQLLHEEKARKNE